MPQTNGVQLMPPKLPLRRVSPQRPTSRRRERAPIPRRPQLGPVMVALCLCLAGMVVYMWPRVHIVRQGYRIQTLEQRARVLFQEREQLRLEIASLKDPQRVYQVATERLGMMVPSHEQIFVLLHERKGP